MADNYVFEAMQARFRARLKTRILAFGSSNTEHLLPGMHWFEVLDLALLGLYGRIHHSINTGVGGHTTRQLLARFDDDAAFYRPHLAFITIGGNDSFPFNNLPAEEFDANLRELHRRFASMGTAVVFQTYYSPDPARNGDLQKFYGYMDVVRAVAAGTKSGLVDHLCRWEAFRLAFPERYLALMEDGFHVNRRGNMVMGLDIARHFGVKAAPREPTYWSETMAIQKEMDALVPASVVN
ncbi:MAG: SGNH/GDSL hydrolase family protein [bacterium]